MTLLAPLALIALAVWIIPLVIHLLTRRSAAARYFPAVAFLLAGTGGRSSPDRWRHPLVLALRTIAVTALVFALAGLAWSGAASSASRQVILLDASGSMRGTHAGATSFLRAQEAVRALLDQAGEVQLVVCGDTTTSSRGLPGPGTGPERALLAEATPGWGSGSVAREAGAAALRLAGLGGGEIIVVGDGTRSGRSGVVTSLPAGVALRFLDVPAPVDNCAVLRLGLAPGALIAGGSARLLVELGNSGDTPVTAAVLLTAGEQRHTASVRIPAAGTARLDWPVSAPAGAAALVVSAAITASEAPRDAWPEDDRRAGLIPVVPATPVLVVSDLDPQDRRGALHPLLAALRAAGLSPLVVGHASAAEVLAVQRPRPALVTIGLAAPPPGLDVQSFLLDGGAWLAWLMTPGDEALVAAPKDLPPPARPAPRVDLTSRSRGIGVAVARGDHPLLAHLAGREGLLRQVECWAYRPCLPVPGATVLLAHDDGAVALADRPVGQGRWLLGSISLAEGDSNLAALDALPLLLAPLPHLLLPRELADTASPCGHRLMAEGDWSGPAPAPLRGGLVQLAAPGVYRDSQGLPQAAAGIPALESDLRATAVPSPTGTAAAGTLRREDTPLWPWMLALAVTCLALELAVLGRRGTP